MLKLIYSELGLHLEHLPLTVEEVLACRVVLAAQMGQAIHLEPSRASFLLPAGFSQLEELETAIANSDATNIAIGKVDDSFVEVNLRGTWLARTPNAEEGIFVTAVGDEWRSPARHLEPLVYQLWQVRQAQASYLM